MQICHETMYYVLSIHILKWKTPSVEHKPAAHNCSLHTETGNVKYQTTIEQWPPKTSSTLQESTYINHIFLDHLRSTAKNPPRFVPRFFDAMDFGGHRMPPAQGWCALRGESLLTGLPHSVGESADPGKVRSRRDDLKTKRWYIINIYIYIYYIYIID